MTTMMMARGGSKGKSINDSMSEHKCIVTSNIIYSITVIIIIPIHSLRVGWRNFFPVVLLCQFLVLAGNRFWFYILTYLEYNTVVALC
jgi:hypothetical protein